MGIDFLDTSVVMYAAGKKHEYKEPCVSVPEKIERHALEVAIDTEVV